MSGSIKNLKPSGNSKYESGYYIPKNEFKYKGDLSKIIIRSSYEKRMCQYCDFDEEVLEWSSEPIGIRYTSLVDDKQHTYWIDFWLKMKDGREFLVEVKPGNRLKKPRKPKNTSSRSWVNYENNLKTYLVNYSKWKAAYEYAKINDMEFIIAEEEFLFNFR